MTLVKLKYMNGIKKCPWFAVVGSQVYQSGQGPTIGFDPMNL